MRLVAKAGIHCAATWSFLRILRTLLGSVGALQAPKLRLCDRASLR